MKIIKNLMAAIMDLLLIISLTIYLVIVSVNSLGEYSLSFSERDTIKNVLLFVKIGGSFLIIYLILSALNRWKTIGRQLLGSSGKMIFKSLLALIIDFTIILSVTYSVHLFINGFVYIGFFCLFAFFIIFYHFLAGIFLGKTLGKLFFGIRITGKNDTLSKVQRLKREVLFKTGFLFLFPWLLFRLIGIVDPFNIFIDVVGLALSVAILFFVFRGELWWNKLTDTRKEFVTVTKLKKITYFGCIAGVLLSSLIITKYINNSQQNSSMKTLGFNTPLNFPEYPNLPGVKKYSEYMALQSLSPKDYILGLFDKYDIVVLCENYHGETTQWELISEIVSDKRFVEKVGNVFTEYGSSRHQTKVDTFLLNRYNSEADVEKAAASLMEYQTGGFFYFMKRLNLQNSLLPDSLKVKEHFTDNLDWDYLSYNRFSEKGLDLDNRDSIMAQVTIDWYNENLKQGKTKKCLLVTNTRHAYGYAGGLERLKKLNIYHISSGNQAQYIYEAFPDKTACVLQNAPENRTKTLFKAIYLQINNGIWDKAYKENNFRPVGFDLNGSPFGLDSFEMHPLFGARPKVLYQDIFTGLVFNRRFEDLREDDYPFKRFAVGSEYALKYPEADSISIQNKINRGRWAGVTDRIDASEPGSIQKSIVWANILSLQFVVILAFFSLSIIILSLIIHLFKKRI